MLLSNLNLLFYFEKKMHNLTGSASHKLTNTYQQMKLIYLHGIHSFPNRKDDKKFEKQFLTEGRNAAVRVCIL